MTGPGGAANGHPRYEVMGVTRYWRYSREQMADLITKALVVQPNPGAVPRRKCYLDEGRGVAVPCLWDDIPNLHANAKERTGYPTQKPVALLERIIEASSTPGDMVLDPFCGSGTTLVAADRLQRQWVGIDLSPLAIKLVDERLREDRGALFDGVTHRQDVPVRTDHGAARRASQADGQYAD